MNKKVTVKVTRESGEQQCRSLCVGRFDVGLVGISHKGDLKMSEVKRAVVYARVSTEDQARYGYSLQSQVEEGRKYAQENGWTVVNTVMDDGVSGAKIERPGLNRIFDMAENGEFDVLVVYEIDRLARKMVYQQLIELNLEESGVKIDYVRGDFDDSNEGQLYKNLLGAIAEFERTQIAARNRRGKLMKARDGKVVGAGRCTYGYDYHDDQYLINETQARVVRMIYDWYLEGESIRGIVRKLDDQGVLTQQGNDHWAKSSVSKILDNETYAGTFYYNRREVQPDGSREFRDESEWIEISVPVIIERDKWEAVQTKRERNKKRLRRRPKRKYLLSGFIRCEVCDLAYSGNYSKGHRYYRDGGRNHRSLRAEVAEAAVWNAICHILTDQDSLTEGWKERQALSQQERERVEKRIEEYIGLRKRALAKLDRLTDTYIDVDIHMTRDEYIRRREQIQDEVNSLNEQLAELEEKLTTKEVTEEQIANFERFADEIREHLESASWEVKHRILEHLQITGWVKWVKEAEAKIRLEGLIPTFEVGLSSTTS
jgi:site-specific DNA recombinase